MKELIKDETKIENLIYEIRGKQVMLDSDLAKLYNCANGTKTINLAVKRHIDRFPDDFYFQLTKSEFENLKFQFETSSQNNYGGIRKMPYVFTEQGVAMLSSVLRTEVASNVSVLIMRAFVRMKHYISSNLVEQKHINNIVLEDHNKIMILENTFKKFEENRKVNELFFNGQIYDAYSKVLDIYKSAKKELIIIDSYADKTVLDIIKNLNINVTLITKKDNLLTKELIDRYNKQYSNLKVVFNNTFHDRYFILDKKEIYHCGTSLNRIGYKTFSINIISDFEVCKLLIDKITKTILKTNI